MNHQHCEGGMLPRCGVLISLPSRCVSITALWPGAQARYHLNAVLSASNAVVGCLKRGIDPPDRGSGITV